MVFCWAAAAGVAPRSGVSACAARATSLARRCWGGGLVAPRRRASGYATAANGHFSLTVPRRDEDVVIQVYGANTGVGKTVVGTGLCAAALRGGLLTSYIKPVQTGTETDADAVARIITPEDHVKEGALATATLFSFASPISPHLAAARDGRAVTDGQVLQALADTVDGALRAGARDSRGTFSLIETSGGVLSPGPSGTLQADLFRPLRLPVLLVGDPHLGGIGTTLSVLESLRIRGYTVAGVAFIGAGVPPGREHLGEFAAGNADAVEAELRDLGVPVFRVGPPLPPPEVPLNEWHAGAARGDFDVVISALRGAWRAELTDALTHKDRALRRVWWPFTQHTGLGPRDVTTVDSAYGNHFLALEGTSASLSPSSNTAESATGTRGYATSTSTSPAAATNTTSTSGLLHALHDGPASWWTQGLGHGNPELALAVAEAAGRYGHVLFPNVSHAPAVQLAEALVERGPGAGWASRAFFTDDGSTGMEVAIKMALRRFSLDRWGPRGAPRGATLEVVAQSNCYHGDTLGVMDVAERSVFNAQQHPWYSPRGLFLEPPTLAWRDSRYALDMSPALADALAAVGAPRNALRGAEFQDRSAAFDVSAREGTPAGRALARAYATHAEDAMEAHECAAAARGAAVTLGALVIEPVLLGAGGMHLTDPLWQRALATAARRRGLPVVYDEVFSGLWRLGYESCRDALGVDPDVAVYAKLLTGGLLPMSVTLASARVFDAFAGDSKAAALLHGHSYTAHPTGCAAALHALGAYERGPHYRGHRTPAAEQWDDAGEVRELSRLPNVTRALSIGTAMAVEIAPRGGGGSSGYSGTAGAEAAAVLRGAGVLARPLGNVVYCMVTPHTAREECSRLLGVYRGVLEKMS